MIDCRHLTGAFNESAIIFPAHKLLTMRRGQEQIAVQRKVLIVGAEAKMVSLLKILLESDGYQIVWARDNEGAQAILQEDRVDGIVLDLQHAEANMLATIAEFYRLFEAPLIVLSTNAGRDVHKSALQAGASAYFVKPFSAQALLNEVAAHLP